MFVMRLSNERDQALIRSAVSDAGASLLTFIPSLGTGEVFAFGAGVPLPTRMKFREVPLAQRPTSEAGGNTRLAAGASPDRDMIGSVIERWRASTMSHKADYADDSELGSWRDDCPLATRCAVCHRRSISMQPRDAPPHARRLPSPRRPAAPEPHRASILRRPLTARTESGPDNPAPLPQPLSVGHERSAARAEDRAADAHVGRAHGDGDRHSPRSCPSTAACRPLRAAILAVSAKCGAGASSAGGMHISPSIASP